VQKFHYVVATTAQQIRDAQRLRWTVYAEEEGLLEGATPVDGRETDARDYCEGTTHLLVYDGQELAGTVRLLEPRGTLGLDLAAKFDLGALSAPGTAPAEVTRYCVLRRYRCTGVTSALFSGLYAESSRRRRDGAPATDEQRRRTRGGDLTGLELPRTLSLFAKRMGGSYLGLPAYDAHSNVFALPLVATLADHAARRSPAGSPARAVAEGLVRETTRSCVTAAPRSCTRTGGRKMKTERTPIHTPFDAGCANDTARPSIAPPASGRRSIVVPSSAALLGSFAGFAIDWAEEATPKRDKVPRGATPMKPMKPGGRDFPTTKWTLVCAGAASPAALQELCADYHGPLLAFARRLELDPQRAEDLVQGFLIRILEQKVVDKADRAQGRFRTFLRQALRNHAINLHHAEKAEKRGGKVTFVEPAEGEIASEALAADRLYDRAWARALVDRALARLRDERRSLSGNPAVFEALADRLEGDDDGATLLEVASKLGMSEVAVKVALFRLRRRYFDLVRAEVGATVERPEDVDPELRSLRAALRGEG
jgi:RNA polymerase sigma-70 factor (ECF subfamily)